MSLATIFQKLNSPIVVLGCGSVVLLALPTISASTSVASLGLLRASCVAAFTLNCLSVSVPGRIDGQAQDAMQGTTSKIKDNGNDETYINIYSPNQGRTLVAPAGWAFAIWGPIYLGEAIFCTSLLLETSSTLLHTLPVFTAPFVAANIFQSLWCASFRPSYMTTNSSWEKYVSAAMLGGTAYSLSLAVSPTTPTILTWPFIPIIMHFGWTTAATLVNLNGSIAMSNASDTTVIAVGHTSAVLATLLGIGVTFANLSPVYGLTIAWALAACSDGMKKRQLVQEKNVSSTILRGMKVQQLLCSVGSGLCAISGIVSYLYQ